MATFRSAPLAALSPRPRPAMLAGFAPRDVLREDLGVAAVLRPVHHSWSGSPPSGHLPGDRDDPVLRGRGLGWKTFDHVQTRVEVWLEPWEDPSVGASRSSRLVLPPPAGDRAGPGLRPAGSGSGGLTRDLHSAIGEELGLLGGLLVPVAFVLMVGRRPAHRPLDRRSAVLTSCWPPASPRCSVSRLSSSSAASPACSPHRRDPALHMAARRWWRTTSCLALLPAHLGRLHPAAQRGTGQRGRGCVRRRLGLAWRAARDDLRPPPWLKPATAHEQAHPPPRHLPARLLRPCSPC